MSVVNRNSEKKYIDTAIVSTNIQTSGVFIGMPFMAQGTTKQDRIGDNVFIRYWKLAFSVQENGSATWEYRVSVVRQRTALGLAPVSWPQALYVPFNPELFHVIYDKTFTLGPTTGVTTAPGSYVPHIREHKLTIPIMQGFKIQAGQYIDPQYFLYLWAPDTIIPSPFVIGYTRLTFSDM